MAEIVTCPACEKKLQVPDELLGQSVQCPECKHPFEARSTASSISAAAPEPPTVPREGAAPRQRWQDEEDDLDAALPRRERLPPNRGPVILTMGIISLVMMGTCLIPLILGPICWVMGNHDLEAIRNGDMDREGEGMVQAGRVLGIVGFIVGLLLLIGWCLYILFFVFIFAVAAGQPRG